ncbi:hypothetical protein TUA1478L_07520 [Lactiplantibacillus plantarum]
MAVYCLFFVKTKLNGINRPLYTLSSANAINSTVSMIRASIKRKDIELSVLNRVNNKNKMLGINWHN